RKSLNALQEMNDRHTTVLRDSKWQSIPTTEMVVGDIVNNQVGDFVEADIRWLDVNELQVIEAHLTGEADAIEKNTAPIPTEVEVGDQTNMGFSGSTVSNGQGLGVVVAVGSQTQLGDIAQMIQAVETKPSPLQNTVKSLTKTLMLVSAALVIFTFVVETIIPSIFSFPSFAPILPTSIALSISYTPYALSPGLSLVHTIGSRKMAQNHYLIKSLQNVETLGATPHNCLDKT